MIINKINFLKTRKGFYTVKESLTDPFFKGLEIWNFVILYICTIVINYYAPDVLRIMYFYLLLIIFYLSKKNAFWIAFFVCLIYAPGYLFHTLDPNYHLPLISIPGFDRDFFYFEIVTFLIILKTGLKKGKFKSDKIFYIIVSFSVLLFFLSFYFGISTMKILRTIRFLIPFSLIWTLPKLFNTKDNYEVLLKYFLLFTFFVFFCQLYVVITGTHFFSLFGGNVQLGDNKEFIEQYNVDEQLIRPLYSTHLALFNIFSIFYFLSSNQITKRVKNLLYLLLLICFFSFVIGGTRGYVLSSIIMITLFLLFYKKFILRYLLWVIGFILLIPIGYLLIPSLKNQISFSIERILTIQALTQGDLTAEGTLTRLTERLPVILEKFTESPIIGFGFSDVYYQFSDGHVALASILLCSGFIGFGLFVYFVVYLINKIYLKTKRNKVVQYYSLIIGLIGFLFVHSTSYMVFNFLIGEGNSLFFLILLSFINLYFIYPSERKIRLVITNKNIYPHPFL